MSFKSSGPRTGDCDVVARVPVDVGYGYFCHWKPTGSPHEFFPVYNASLKTIHFQLTNAKGDAVDLHGGTVSIELCFNDFTGPI